MDGTSERMAQGEGFGAKGVPEKEPGLRGSLSAIDGAALSSPERGVLGF